MGLQQLTDQLSTLNTLKEKMISTLEKAEGVLIKGGRKLTGKEMADEIRQETALGVDLMNMMIQLTIDLVMRDKINQEPNKVEQLIAENEELKLAGNILTKLSNELKSENERLREAQRWIPVTERLPESFIPVLFSAPDFPHPLQGYYVEDGNVWMSYLWAQNEVGVTHWMPLPEKSVNPNQ